jgi:tetratricopeptide (TPR) repeat protein
MKQLLATVCLLAALAAWAPAAQPASQPTTQPAPKSGLSDALRKIIDVVKPGDAKATTAPASQPASAPTPANLDDCHKAYAAGQYDRAIAGYQKLLDVEEPPVAAAIGLSEALAIKGEYDKALEALDKVADKAKRRFDFHHARAEVLAVIGRYDQALAAATTANELRPLWAPAIFTRGRLLETLGRKDEAVEVYSSMDRVVSGSTWRKDPASLVALGQILDRYTVLTGRKASEQAGNILNNYLQEAYLQVDETYWPAHLAAAEFAFTKHRPDVAAKELQAALKLNGNLPQAHLLIAAVQLGGYQFENCLKSLDMAKVINPNHPDLHLLRALCMMQWRKYEQVEPAVQKALEINPNHLDALSLLAALHIRNGQEDKAQPYIERVEKVNPRYPGLPNMIGEWLAAGRQFTQAEGYYRKAIDLDPDLADGWTNLGLMYMQTGDEDEARKVLAKAHSIDDFRRDVVNYLKILGELQKFATRETEHFIVRVHPTLDAVLLDQAAEFMEKIHAEICSDFQHEPAEKTIIEFFPDHPQFSIRISGRGWIGTVGAATGRVIVMVAPNRERSQFGTYNWATVLRHEYTHTVTLSATDNRIPHWFTEACAVWQQPDRRNYQAVQLLVNATRRGSLFPMNEIDWGFVRPKKNGDRSLAYAQSEWAMEHIIETRGYDTIIKMLRAFRDGKTQKQVFAEILQTTEKEFDQTFAKWAMEQIASWGFETDNPGDPRKLQAAFKKNPDDAEAKLGWAKFIGRRNPRLGVKLAQELLEKDSNNTEALAVLAQAQLGLKEYDEAEKAALKLNQIEPDSRIAAYVLSEVYLQQREWAKAIAALEAVKTRAPLSPYSYQHLAKIYVQLGQPERALPNLIELHRRTMNDPKYARQVAEIQESLGNDESALAFYGEIPYINPYEVTAYEAMAAIHLRRRDYPKALEEIGHVVQVDPGSADGWSKVAMIRYRAGKASDDAAMLQSAREAAERARELDSANTNAIQVLHMIDAVLGPKAEEPQPADAATSTDSPAQGEAAASPAVVE